MTLKWTSFFWTSEEIPLIFFGLISSRLSFSKVVAYHQLYSSAHYSRCASQAHSQNERGKREGQPWSGRRLVQTRKWGNEKGRIVNAG